MKARSNRRSIQTSVRRDTDTSWFEQGLAGALYPGDFTDLVGQFPGGDESRAESGAVAGFNGWEANLQPFSPTSLNSVVAPSTADAAPIPTPLSTTNGREDSEDVDDDKDPSDALSSQLTSLSQRATRAIRRLVRPGRALLTVSSPEVNEALEDTNILIRIIDNMTAPDRGDVTLDPAITNYGLAFSALACHQHLVALFRAICDGISRSLQSKKEHQEPQKQHRNRQHSDVGPSSVAQFVMVLQLLTHLINRLDRSLFQSNASMLRSAELSTGGYNTPVTPNVANHHTIDPIQSEAAAGDSSPRGSLLILVQNIVGTIPNEHERLRQVVQKLQTEMDHLVLLH